WIIFVGHCEQYLVVQTARSRVCNYVIVGCYESVRSHNNSGASWPCARRVFGVTNQNEPGRSDGGANQKAGLRWKIRLSIRGLPESRRCNRLKRRGRNDEDQSGPRCRSWQGSSQLCLSRISNGAISTGLSFPPPPLSGSATTDPFVSLSFPAARIISRERILLPPVWGTTGVTFFTIPACNSAAAVVADCARQPSGSFNAASRYGIRSRDIITCRTSVPVSLSNSIASLPGGI